VSIREPGNLPSSRSHQPPRDGGVSWGSATPMAVILTPGKCPNARQDGICPVGRPRFSWIPDLTISRPLSYHPSCFVFHAGVYDSRYRAALSALSTPVSDVLSRPQLSILP
jgi:hypothetical protein